VHWFAGRWWVRLPARSAAGCAAVARWQCDVADRAGARVGRAVLEAAAPAAPVPEPPSPAPHLLPLPHRWCRNRHCYRKTCRRQRSRSRHRRLRRRRYRRRSRRCRRRSRCRLRSHHHRRRPSHRRSRPQPRHCRRRRSFRCHRPRNHRRFRCGARRRSRRNGAASDRAVWPCGPAPSEAPQTQTAPSAGPAAPASAPPHRSLRVGRMRWRPG